jgi:hypothetical protein
LESIATRYAGKPVAARALVEMGQAEEQLGHRDRARAAYARVLADYRGEARLVAMARQDLASMGEAPSGPRNLSFEQGEPGKVPDGWFAGEGYSAELRRTGCHSTIGCVVVLIPAIHPDPASQAAKRFGYLMQSFSAVPYRGKMVRLHAWMRLDSVTQVDKALMWFRVDRANGGFYDNMWNRPVRSAAWTEAQIVGRIESDAERINFGVSSVGGGNAWVDGVTFEVIADGVPTMGPPPNQPVNLSFGAARAGGILDGWVAPGGLAKQERQGCRSAACASVWLPEGSSDPFANIMQQVNAANYRGKTVRIRAWLRLDAATPADTAQMWFRVDRADKRMGAFDNMDDRPVKSAQWTAAEIVGKVADDAELLNIGVMAIGKGRAWVDGMTFEIVPEGAPETAKALYPDRPRNLSLERGEIGKVPEGWLTPAGRAEWTNRGCRGAGCAFIWLEPGSTQPFASLMQVVKAEVYRGKTVRLRAWLRVDAAAPSDRAQIWFRVDLPNGQMGALDNMDDRPVKAADWTPVEIVAKVDADAATLNFGAISVGSGKAWVDGVTLEIVPDDTPNTAKSHVYDAPRNLDFAKGESGKVPEGWIAPVGHAELSRQGCRGSGCAAIWLDPDSTEPFGNLMQWVYAAAYRGKTVRLRAWLRLDAATRDDKVQMWFRVDLPNRQPSAFDNMDDRPVQSFTWTPAEIVVKVADGAWTFNFGVMSIGKGHAWVDGMTLEVVDDATPLTGMHR